MANITKCSYSERYKRIIKYLENIIKNITIASVDCVGIRTHPAYIDTFIFDNTSMDIVRAFEVEVLTLKIFKELLQDNGINLISYKDILC